MDKVQLVKAVAEAAKTAQDAGRLGRRTAFADLVVEVVQPNHLSLDLFSTFMPVTQMQPGDLRGRRVRRGRYPIRTMVPGSKHLTDVLDYLEYQTFMFDRLIAGTSHSVWEIASGEVGTVEQMRTELRADLFDEIVSKVFSLLTTVWTSGLTPNNYVDASGTGVTATALDAMIETLLDYTGQVKAIIGSRAALLPIYRFSQYREFVPTSPNTNAFVPIVEKLNEFAANNRVSTYLGIPLIELPQVYRNRLPANATGGLRDAGNRMIPTDKILVIGGNVGEIALMGGFEYADYTDPTTQPANYVLHGWQGYGMIVDDVAQIGIIKTNT
jgi:hypothetical protein